MTIVSIIKRREREEEREKKLRRIFFTNFCDAERIDLLPFDTKRNDIVILIFMINFNGVKI